jgi:recombinase
VRAAAVAVQNGPPVWLGDAQKMAKKLCEKIFPPSAPVLNTSIGGCHRTVWFRRTKIRMYLGHAFSHASARMDVGLWVLHIFGVFRTGALVSRFILAHRAAGNGRRKIAMALTVEGFPTKTGAPWSPQAIRTILEREKPAA